MESERHFDHREVTFIERGFPKRITDFCQAMVEGKPKTETKKQWNFLLQGVTELSELFKRKEREIGEYRSISAKQKVEITSLELELRRVKEELRLLKGDPSVSKTQASREGEETNLPDLRLGAEDTPGSWMWYQTVMLDGILKDQARLFPFISFNVKNKTLLAEVNEGLMTVVKKRTDLFLAACADEGITCTPIEMPYTNQLMTSDQF